MSFAKRKLAVGIAGLAVLAGTGGAYAATQSSPSTSTAKRPDPATEQKAFLDDLATRLNVTRDKLDAAIKGAASDRIDAAVAAGQLTKAQGDEIKKRLESTTGLPLGGLGLGLRAGGPHPAGPGAIRGPLGFGFGHGKSLSSAASFLGLTDAQLRAQLQAGKSLADIAKDKGKSTADLKAAMKSTITAELDDIINNTPPKGMPAAPRFRWR